MTSEALAHRMLHVNEGVWTEGHERQISGWQIEETTRQSRESRWKTTDREIKHARVDACESTHSVRIRKVRVFHVTAMTCCQQADDTNLITSRPTCSAICQSFLRTADNVRFDCLRGVIEHTFQSIRSFISDSTVHIKSKERRYRETDRVQTNTYTITRGKLLKTNSLTHDCGFSRAYRFFLIFKFFYSIVWVVWIRLLSDTVPLCSAVVIRK